MEKYKAIKPLDHSAMEEAQRYIDGLAKPIGSLGELEKYAVRLAGIRGYMGCPFRKGGVLVFAADNGVHEESITPVPQATSSTRRPAFTCAPSKMEAMTCSSQIMSASHWGAMASKKAITSRLSIRCSCQSKKVAVSIFR